MMRGGVSVRSGGVALLSALAILGAACGGGGTDEGTSGESEVEESASRSEVQVYADAVAMVLGSQEDTVCLADGYVTVVGIDRLEEIGSPEEVAEIFGGDPSVLPLVGDEWDAMAQVVVDCTPSLGDGYRSILDERLGPVEPESGSGPPAAYRECILSIIDDEFLVGFYSDGMRMAPASVELPDLFNSVVVADAEACLATVTFPEDDIPDWVIGGPGGGAFAASESKSAGPTANEDHWHAAYGVWDCVADDGGEFLPPFQSTDDPLGIHSHQDGLTHIHPFFSDSAGTNAVTGVFFDAMGVEVAEAGIVMPDGTLLEAGVECEAGPAIIQIAKWPLASAVDEPPTIYTSTEDMNEIVYLNDAEAYTIARAPAGAEIPPPESIPNLTTVSDSYSQEGLDLDGDGEVD